LRESIYFESIDKVMGFLENGKKLLQERTPYN